jgi:6-phosphogluconolactonase
MNKPQLDIRVEESPPALAADATETFVRLAQRAVASNGLFRVALSGGSTPRLLYGLLASDTFRQEVPWEHIRFFFGDERWVPRTSKESNYRLANDELFKKVSVDPANVFPMPTEGLSPDEAAAQYEDTLRAQFNLKENEVPSFDLIFLGMGDDGHTASIFPGTSAVHEREKLVVAPYVEKLAAHRITLTPPVLQAAEEVVFLVIGESKAPALKQVLEGLLNIDEYPAQLLRQAQGRVTWYVDRSAASQLEGTYVQA